MWLLSPLSAPAGVERGWGRGGEYNAEKNKSATEIRFIGPNVIAGKIQKILQKTERTTLMQQGLWAEKAYIRPPAAPTPANVPAQSRRSAATTTAPVATSQCRRPGAANGGSASTGVHTAAQSHPISPTGWAPRTRRHTR